MKTTICFPCDWKSELFDFSRKHNLTSTYKYQEKSIELFGKIDLLNEIKTLKTRLKILEEQREHEKNVANLMRTLSDDEAENEIDLFIQRKKFEGSKTLNMLDLMQELKLPSEQIEKIMKNLEKKGVKSVYD
jgi:predicted transcriptional regulator